MKSLKGKIIRVSDERASELYHEGYQYLPKSEWKEEVRDVKKPKAGDVGLEWQDKHDITKTKFNKMSKAHKRQMKKTL